MAIKRVTPYLNFNGNAAQAIKLYQSALGAQVEGLSKFGDAEQMGHSTPPESRDLVMHAVLRWGDVMVMLSDGMPGVPVPAESNQHVCLDFDDVTDMTKKFEALAVGGQITMPLNDTFWGAKFGMVKDAFAINWMFNCETKKT